MAFVSDHAHIVYTDGLFEHSNITLEQSLDNFHKYLACICESNGYEFVECDQYWLANSKKVHYTLPLTNPKELLEGCDLLYGGPTDYGIKTARIIGARHVYQIDGDVIHINAVE